jgi:hypothetical protein
MIRIGIDPTVVLKIVKNNIIEHNEGRFGIHLSTTASKVHSSDADL